jgi:amidase
VRQKGGRPFIAARLLPDWTHYRGHYYAKAQNMVRHLRAAYDATLANYDLLLMPTVPLTATKLPAEDAARAFELLSNTAPFDCTHHPAMSVPCGMVEGLPVGMMLVGRMYAEATIHQAAAAFEVHGKWKSLIG